jgi:hypothetical protein
MAASENRVITAVRINMAKECVEDEEVCLYYVEMGVLCQRGPEGKGWRPSTI